MVSDSKSELYEQYANGDISEEQYIEQSEELDRQIEELTDYIKLRRDFYDEAGVTDESNVYLAVALMYEMRYKYLYFLASGYEYLPQKYSVFRYDYNSEYIKTHSGITLTLSWNIKVTDNVPKGEFYFNPLLSNIAGIRRVAIVNKELVWQGKKLRVLGYSPIYSEAIPDGDEFLMFKLYKDVLPSIVVI